MRVRVIRVLHAKLYASEILYENALPGSTARQLFNSSTLLDSSTARQNSTDLDRPRHPGTCSQPRLASTGSTATRQLLDSYSTTTRQLLDSYSTGSTGKALTAPRQWPRQRLDGASTAVDPARQPRGSIHNRHHTGWKSEVPAPRERSCAQGVGST